ncbi:MAG TPA: hypothetical protein VK464_12815 [Symbiobacteriaceae bacterium]|jgi:hypothetical protein|nr:hypothetical protein [Symbiobacteriaceae bacterium]
MQKVQDLLWLWMILGVTILPAVKNFLVSVRRKTLVARVEKQRGTKVITKFWKLPHLMTA